MSSNKNAKAAGELLRLGKKAKEIHAEIVGLERKSIAKAIEAGRVVLEARPYIQHGDFDAWAKRYVGSDQTARNYSAVAEVASWSKAKEKKIQSFTSLTAAYIYAHNEISLAIQNKKNGKSAATSNGYRTRKPGEKSFTAKIENLEEGNAPKDKAPISKACRNTTPGNAIESIAGKCPVIRIRNVQSTFQSVFSALQSSGMTDVLRSIVRDGDKHLLIRIDLNK